MIRCTCCGTELKEVKHSIKSFSGNIDMPLCDLCATSGPHGYMGPHTMGVWCARHPLVRAEDD